MRKVKIFDSTLRDGEYTGYNMNLREKLEMARQLERLGVDVIEAGYPNSSPDEFDAVKNIAKTIKTVTVCALARCIESDIKRACDALKYAKSPQLHIFLGTSPEKLQKLKQSEAIERTATMIRFARNLCPNVMFSAEDAIHTDKDFLMSILDTAVAAGASTISISDTNGYSTPGELYNLISYVKNNLQNPNVDISIHAHNDLGLGVANALEGIRAGAIQVECTVNGIGERAGNTALEEIVMAISSCSEIYDCETKILQKELYRSSKLLSTITGVPIPPNKPIVGVFSSGINSGEHNSLNKHTTQIEFAQRICDLGYTMTKEDLDEAFMRFQIITQRKKELGDRDIEALLISTSHDAKETYQLKSFVINSGTVISATAVVCLIKDNGQEIENVARGEGPIDAAFKAIDRIVNLTGTLENWTMQAVTEGEDALGEAVSKIICDGKRVTGRGLSTDILEASIKSYLDAINKAIALH